MLTDGLNEALKCKTLASIQIHATYCFYSSIIVITKHQSIICVCIIVSSVTGNYEFNWSGLIRALLKSSLFSLRQSSR